jgi:hypothetical protein
MDSDVVWENLSICSHRGMLPWEITFMRLVFDQIGVRFVAATLSGGSGVEAEE